MKEQKLLKTIDWYIIKKFIGTYVVAIVLILAISVMFDFNEKLDKFIRNGASTHAIIFDYYLNFIPAFANLFSPLFVFIAVIFFTYKDNLFVNMYCFSIFSRNFRLCNCLCIFRLTFYYNTIFLQRFITFN